jgi:GTP cyclohydrolase I
MQIANYLQEVLKTDDVAIIMDAKHLCVSSRGIKDNSSSTVTSFYGGKFKEEAIKKELMSYVDFKTRYE